MINNRQYQELKVKPGEFIPDPGIDYPEDPTVHLYSKPHVKDFAIDETYPYYEDSFSFKFNRAAAWLKCHTLVFFMNWLIFGFKCEGKENLKKYKDVLKKPGITTCNHAYRWDMVSIIQATGWSFYIPMFGENMKTKDYWHMKYIGGVPIPTGLQAMKKYDAAFDRRHEEGSWVHLFPEGISWPFYKPLKPFHKGAFTMAYRWGCPVLPLYITYRPRTGWRKWTGKANVPLITTHIGVPVMPDMTLPRKKAVEKLTKEVWDQMLEMGGITHNPWPCFIEDWQKEQEAAKAAKAAEAPAAKEE